jgi:N-acetylmuramoyl-L-alanine amidase
LSLSLEASTYHENLAKYNEAKRKYISIAMGYSDKKDEAKYLKQLIYYGKKIKKSTWKYEHELKRLYPNEKVKVVKKPKVIKKKPVIQNPKPKPVKKSKYSIASVIQEDNKVIINFNKKVSKKDIKYFITKRKKSLNYVFDLNGRFKDAKPTKLHMLGLDRIKVLQYRYNTLRIIFQNKSKIKPVYHISKNSIKITVLNLKKQPKKTQNYVTIKKKTIVIDAGHGGKDAGAVGPRRRYEKVVVLNISKYLYKNLKQRGYRVFLTRDKDKYISLRSRTKFANSKNADMFISIHANAARKSRTKIVRGVETYFLSPARSEKAKRVAALENKGDMDAMNWSSKNTFLTVLNQGKITASNKMAIDIQKNILYSLRKRYGKNVIRDGGVREGPFWVLLGAQMPSVLIEIGYISHPSESRRIYTRSYQKLIAQSIANGIDSYFLKNQ